MKYIELSVHRHVPYTDRYTALVESVRYRIEREPYRGWQVVSQAGTVVARGRTLRELDEALGAVARIRDEIDALHDRGKAVVVRVEAHQP